jgi:GDP/UDP-N,N'-diacetylbacillosamine 2-epimerase (hydrolysing)
METKKVLAITGIRSEYDILSPVLHALQQYQFDVKVIVSGSHLSSWHGDTLSVIERNFRIADKIDSLFMTDRETQRVKGVGPLLLGMAQTVEREQPDYLLVVGDREESIATALIGNYMGILVAHLAGGDPVYGHTDDPIRHAVSKLAHIHFVMAEAHGRILRRMGEEEFRIFNVGNPSLDLIKSVPYMELQEVSKRLGFDINDGNYVVLIKHPLATEKEDSYEQMRVTLEALTKLGQTKALKSIGIFPNTDPGSAGILDAVNEYKNSTTIRFYKTLERELFVNLVRNAKALVGNSSMGILEAPFLKLPVVNVGMRQTGRINCGNVRFVQHDVDEISNAVEKACFDQNYREVVDNVINIYGNGDTGERIAQILQGINNREKRWHVKRLSYLEEVDFND